MTCDLAKNGEWTVTLVAVDPIEQAILDQFSARAQKGTRVELKQENGRVTIRMVDAP